MNEDNPNHPEDIADTNPFADHPKATGRSTVRCHRCRETSEIDISEIEFETETGDERDMGFEASSRAELHQRCPECDSDHSVIFEYYEYPLGSISQLDGFPRGVTHATKGCDLVSDPFNPIVLEHEHTIEELFGDNPPAQ